MRRSFKYRLDKPFSDCLKNVQSRESFHSILYRAMFDELGVKSYRFKYCYQLCQQDFIVDKCNCTNPEFPILKKNQHYAVCNSNRLIVVCSKQKLIEFPSSKFYSKCLEECPVECDTVSYFIEMSSAHYPSDYYIKLLKANGTRSTKIKFDANISEQTLKENILYVRIFYADLTYDTITQVAQITFDQLLGTIGGQLGLFIGISFLSIMEVVELAINLVYILCAFNPNLQVVEPSSIASNR